MPALLEEGQVALADLVGAHHRAGDLRSIPAWRRGTPARYAVTVPWPTITSPAYRHANWPGSRALGGLGQLHAHALVAPRAHLAGQPALQAPSARAHLHAVDAAAVAVQRHLAHAHAVAQQQLARADRDRARARVGREHVQRLATADAEAVALADGERVRAGVLAEHLPRAIDDPPGALAEAAVALQEGALARARQEAQVLRVAPVRDRQAGRRRQLAHLRLGHLSQRKPQPRERLGRERRQHIALVLARVGRGAQQRHSRVFIPDRVRAPLEHPRVVAGRERPRAQPVGQLEHRVEPHVAVAAHARVRRLAGRVVGQPGIDDAGAELGAQVDREVGHAQAVRQLARAADRLRRAAARLAVVLRVGPQLERDPDRLRARARRRAAPRRRCRRRRSSPPACGRRAGPGPRSRAPRRRARGAERRPRAPPRGAWPRSARRARLRSPRRRPLPPPAMARPARGRRRRCRPRCSRRSRSRRSPRRRSARRGCRGRARARPGSDRRTPRRRPRRCGRPRGRVRGRAALRDAGREPRGCSPERVYDSWRASSIVCSIANASVRPLIVVDRAVLVDRRGSSASRRPGRSS